MEKLQVIFFLFYIIFQTLFKAVKYYFNISIFIFIIIILLLYINFTFSQIKSIQFVLPIFYLIELILNPLKSYMINFSFLYPNFK